MRGYPQENVVGGGLCIFELDVEIAILVENAGIDNFVFAIAQAARGVCGDEVGVRKGGLRVFVEHFHIGVRRQSIQIVVELLDVFAVISFSVRETEKTLLQEGIAAVPKSDAHANSELVVGVSGKSVFAPTIGATAGVLVRQILPSRTVGAIILTHRSPLPFAEIGAPESPWRSGCGRQATTFLRLADVRRSRVFCRQGARLGFGCLPEQ